ncbi:cation:proton antiporter [Actinopolymorpha sp. B9G3]|uniref:cation:proton antiporter n=1 Tax=Actinopolymorpha sp. B9G3 TaxID=3158970 RepID=UPI0032D90688
MHSSTGLLVELGMVLLVLSLLAVLARRLALSPVPLYLLAGLAIGDGGVVPTPAAGEFVEVGASIGVVLLLLALGLQFSYSEFNDSMRRHLPSAGVDFLLNATPGAVAGWLLGLGWTGSLALAGVTWVSSSGIVARLLNDLRRMGNRETPSVLAVLVLEDVAMALYLPLMTILAAGGTWRQAVFGVAAASGALLLAFTASHRLGTSVDRMLAGADTEQLLLRVFGLTLLVAGLFEFANASAAVGAFLVGLVLTGEVAERARQVITPLRDLFAAVFFLAIGFTVDPRDLLPVLPAALLLALVTAGTKVVAGWYAAARDGAGPRGRLRAGTVLIARGEFSLVIIGLTGMAGLLTSLATAYVIVLAVICPLATRFTGIAGPSPAALQPRAVDPV